MSHRGAYRLVGWLVACASAGGCIELPDFPEPNIVEHPRALAIIADPPEARPGQSVELSLLLSEEIEAAADAEWFVCGEYFSFAGGNQYGDGESGEGCGADDVRFATGPRATLPGLLGAGLFANLELAREVLGGSLPENSIDLIRERVGLPLLVEARFEHDGKRIRTTKRVLISERAQGNTNPPPPSFMLGKDPITVRDPARPFTCASEPGEPPELPANTAVKLLPIYDGDEEPWTERYQVIDLRGDLHTREETAFYSWYATGGSLDPSVSKAPEREATWMTPRAPGKHRLWVIVRDGHGGASACELAVRIEH